ncbi:MAG: PfkB family carbohydrate kinase [Acidobacteria bacterium]|nr:PfkB family carbohydrate kinase [Acidobacteriota bacterium]
MENEILVVGTVAYDSIETPFGKRERALGGSGVHASLASRFFSKTYLFSTVGEDFEEKDEKLLLHCGIETNGIKKLEGEKTFHWSGSYIKDLNNAETLKTELNALEKFDSDLPKVLRDLKYLFLANIDPLLQNKILSQIKELRFCGMDTMNYWINTKKDEILSLLPKISILFINEAELKTLSEENNIFLGAEKLVSLGLKNLVVKRGEYGAVLFSEDKIFICPAYPLRKVVDPTGAGDTFAGAFLGYVAKSNLLNFNVLKEAMIWGTVASSFCVSDFSVSAIASTSYETLKNRRDEFISFLL